MVTAEVPVLVTETLRVLVAPVGTVPKARDDGVAPRPAWVPVPCRFSGTAPPSVVNVSVPLAPPAAVGVKRTGTDSVPPLLRVTGRAGGVTPNGAVAEMAEMVTVRVAVTVTVALPVPPTATLPKSVGEL